MWIRWDGLGGNADWLMNFDGRFIAFDRCVVEGRCEFGSCGVDLVELVYCIAVG